MRHDSRFALAGVLAMAVTVAVCAGCAAHAPMPAPVPGAPRDTLAVLPLENLSGHAEYGDRLTRIVWTELVASGRWAIVEEGDVEAAIAEARLRSSVSMTRDQALQVAKGTGAKWLMAGTILECGQVRTPDGDVPSVALALRLIDGGTGRVVWTDQLARSGEDRETVFGWGRVTNLERLAQQTTRDLVAAIHLPVEPDSLASGGIK